MSDYSAVDPGELTDDVQADAGSLGRYQAAVDGRAGDGGSLVLGSELGEEEGAGHQATHAVHSKAHRSHRDSLLPPGEGGAGLPPATAAVQPQAGAQLQGGSPGH